MQIETWLDVDGWRIDMQGETYEFSHDGFEHFVQYLQRCLDDMDLEGDNYRPIYIDLPEDDENDMD